MPYLLWDLCNLLAIWDSGVAKVERMFVEF